MTFNDNARSGGGRVSKRGRNTGFAVGGGGIGLIAIFLISQALGVDLTGLVGGGTTGNSASDTTLQNCDTGADANADLECRLRSEEHTSELQSRPHLVCRLLL